MPCPGLPSPRGRRLLSLSQIGSPIGVQIGHLVLVQVGLGPPTRGAHMGTHATRGPHPGEGLVWVQAQVRILGGRVAYKSSRTAMQSY